MNRALGVHTLLVVATAHLLAACSQNPHENSGGGARQGRASPACPAPGPVRAIVIGDRTGRPDDEVFGQTLREAARLKPDFLISVGDLIEGYQPDELMAEAELEWDDVFQRIHAIFGDIPVYATPGNHDVWSEPSQALFERRLNHTVNYAFDVRSARIIILDTSRIYSESEMPEETLDWLWRALYDARDRRARVVVTHRPLWAKDPGGKYGSPLHDVLIAGNADWVITGHWHHAMADYRDGIKYRMIGPTGAEPNRPDHPESGNFSQFGLLTIGEDGADLSLVKTGGILASDEISYEVHQVEWRIENLAVRTEGFELDAVRPQGAGVLRLTVTNVSEERLEGLLTFQKSDAWTVAPRAVPIALAPGRAKALKHRYARRLSSPLFPGPRVRLAFPWPSGGEYLLDKTLDPQVVRPSRGSREAPMVDGDLSDSAWQYGPGLGVFGESKGKVAIPGDTEIKTLFADGTLYIAAAVEEPDMVGQSRRVIERDDYVEDEDHLVIFIDADPETRGYARIAVNAAGTLNDRLVATSKSQEEEISWDGVSEVAAEQGENTWRVEMAIPLKDLGWDGETRRIGFNIWQGRARDHKVSRRHWQPLLEHDVDSFGVLVLPD